MSINSDESINNLIDIENCDGIEALEPELNASSTSTLREGETQDTEEQNHFYKLVRISNDTDKTDTDPITRKNSTNSIKQFDEDVIPEPIKRHCSAFRIASGQIGKNDEPEFEHNDFDTSGCQFCCCISNADQSKSNSRCIASNYGVRETTSADFHVQQISMQMEMDPGRDNYSYAGPPQSAKVSYLDQSTSADYFHQSQSQPQSLANVDNYAFMPQEAQMSGADGYLQSQSSNYYIESSSDFYPGARSAPYRDPCIGSPPSRDYCDYDLGARQMEADSAGAVPSCDFGMNETTAIHQCQVAQRMPHARSGEASNLEYRTSGQNTDQASFPINPVGMPSCINNCGYPSAPSAPTFSPFPYPQGCTPPSSCQQMPCYSHFPSNWTYNGKNFIQNLRSTQPECFPNYQTAPLPPPGMGMNMNYGPSCGPSYPPGCDAICDPNIAGYYANYSASHGPPMNTIYSDDDKLQAQTVYSADFNPFCRPGNNFNHFPNCQASGSWGSCDVSHNCGTCLGLAGCGSSNSGGVCMPPMCSSLGGSCMLPPPGCVYDMPCPANYMSLPTTYCCPPSAPPCHGAAPFPTPNTASYEMPSGCNLMSPHGQPAVIQYSTCT